MSGTDADQSFEISIGRALRIGVTVSSVCLAIGAALTLGGYVQWTAARLLVTGLWILMATPIARIVVSAIGYARQREWLFVLFTLVVLMELVASLVSFRPAH